MKTKFWILLLSILFILCLGLSFFLLMPRGDAAYAEIISNGQLIRTVDLSRSQEIEVTSESGAYNIITVQNGAIGVTAASCPDHYCMKRGMCSSGAQIVCLPNKLLIRFQGNQAVDFVAG